MVALAARPVQHSSELYSAWVAIGLAAAGRDPLTLTRDGHSVLDALRGEASTLQGAGDEERTILALHACGLPASDFPGTSLVAALLRERSSDGSFDQLVNITTFAIFALRVAGSSADNHLVTAAGRWLAAQQDSDGGFGFAGRGGGEDVDDTAAALQAVIDASGQRRGAVVARAVAYLRRAQNPDGGFPQAARQRIQRSVDRVGRARLGRGQCERRRRQTRGQPFAAWLPAEPGGP